MAERQHASVLLPMIDSVLSDNATNPNELDCVAFGSGPGSFTGARIAASVAQGLAFGSDSVVIPVSSLRALAHTACSGQRDAGQTIAPGTALFIAVDAHMNELYTACYRADATVSEIHKDALLTKAQCYQRLAEVLASEGKVEVFGNGIAVLVDYLVELQGHDTNVLAHLKSVPLERLTTQPSALSVLWLAELALTNNEQRAPEHAVPAYLRGSSAWKKITDK